MAHQRGPCACLRLPASPPPSTRNEVTASARVGADGCAVAGGSGGAVADRRAAAAPASVTRGVPGLASRRASMAPTTSTRWPTKRVNSAALAPTSQNDCSIVALAPFGAALSAVVPDPEPAGTEPGTADRGGAPGLRPSLDLTVARVMLSPVAAPCSCPVGGAAAVSGC